jgi:hypothetical protein
MGLNTSLLDIKKHYYLSNYLQPAPAEVNSGITILGDTYSLAWSTLVQRFDKPRQLASSLVEKLLNAPSYDKETLASLSTFLSIFDKASASL